MAQTQPMQAADTNPEPPCDTLLQVADLHFWHVTTNPLRLLNKRALGMLNVVLRRRHEFDASRVQSHIDALTATSCRQILLTGDFTSTSLDEEFEQARLFVDSLCKRGFTPFILPGNHDVYTFESARARRFERYFGEYLPRNGYPSLHELPGGTSLLLVSTIGPNLISSRGRVLDADVRRVTELLAGASDPLVVAGHYPLLQQTSGYALTPERVLRNADLLREALGACGRRVLYVCGHVHRHSFTHDALYPNLMHVSTDTFFGKHRHGPPVDGSFAEIAVYPDGFRVFRHTHLDEWKREASVAD